jgi:hypothetical protein
MRASQRPARDANESHATRLAFASHGDRIKPHQFALSSEWLRGGAMMTVQVAAPFTRASPAWCPRWR